ncbi:sodium-dependent transporter [Paraeggerthella hongkongensis]|uniref:sodium-dependent transporter n=1 Tax=Paraeggerthella TaxID=651554 RepID=UPI000DF73A55|nr:MULTISPECIES: sodium-dependent transporter [Paraeggerthella]MBU5404752.1 sodium-dependent transporter [Paraeggerthella hongkongensis]MCD2433261.1 sodium-dependent transporter [Paraeggerthella hominis]MDY3981997.1 sodium-dependent transporter [Paraeggerthella sp.]RDB59153.1 sodium-dependent transporter [Paraeggerthella hongkongensis]
MAREQFGSRLGFILISAGCAIGLGNVWRFPYITGEYGGAAFVLLYLLFLVIFALPILVMEFAVGRASQKGVARSFDDLEPQGSKWHRFKWAALAGNYLLMMFYTTVAGWMLAFMLLTAMGTFNGMDASGVEGVFNGLLANPLEMTAFMLAVVVIGVLVTRAGLRNGVERVTKLMMVALFAVLAVLCVRAITLPGAEAGLEFYLMPDFGKLFAGGWGTFADAVFAAMGQAFFTVSVGVGSMSIFGSYIDKRHRLAGEAVRIAGLDTLVALMAGLIIFPACFAFGVEPGSGPGLVFITLPSVFEQMPFGQLWGTLFFLFMSFAALSTVIAVFENIMSFGMDQWGWSRKKSCLVNGIALALLSLPCVLGFNVWAGVEVPGIGNIQAIEDFLMSNNVLPLGALVFLLFCTSKRGWGWKAFVAEADTGKGLGFPRWARGYMRFVLPVLILAVFVMGYVPIVRTWMGLG